MHNTNLITPCKPLHPDVYHMVLLQRYIRGLEATTEAEGVFCEAEAHFPGAEATDRTGEDPAKPNNGT